jgi:hypothetical protein
MRLTFSDSCARAASGHAMAALLASVMNSHPSYAPLSRGSHSTTPAALRITANLAAKCLSWAKRESAFWGLCQFLPAADVPLHEPMCERCQEKALVWSAPLGPDRSRLVI